MNETLSKKLSAFSLFAAILVVFIHAPHGSLQKGTVSYFACNFIGEGLCNIAVPFFFAMSGFLLAKHVGDKGWWRTEVLKRVRSILVPYVFWCLVLSSVVAAMIVGANVLHHEPLFRNMESLFPWNFLGLNPLRNPPAPLWYLRTLFVFVLLSAGLFRLVRGFKFAVIVLAVLFMADIFAISVLAKRYPLFYGVIWFSFSLNGLFYFLGGYFLYRYRLKIPAGGGGGAALSLLLGVVFTAVWIVGMDGSSPLIVQYTYYRFGTFFMLVGLWCAIPGISLPKGLSNLSFPIYLMHMPFVTAMGLASAWLIPNYEKTWQAYVVIGVLAIFGSVLMAHLLRKCFPRFAKDIFGGR